MSHDPTANRAFEDRVREICRIRWPSSAYSGAEILGGRERDGVFETEDLIHIVEATVSPRKANAEDNAKKLSGLIKILRTQYPTKVVKGWLITRDEPTADQRTVVKKSGITICSYSQFASSIVDAPTYLEMRSDYSFGSCRNLVNLNDYKNVGEYIDMDILEDIRDSKGSRTRTWPMQEIISALTQRRERIVLVGDFGSGKSTTLREIFLRIKSSYLRDRTRQFPIYLNMRDHWAQRDPDEILERHARKIGYPNGRQLVRAWLAGFVMLILDGFDEVAAEGWTGRRERLRELRQKAMIGVRKFVSQSPKDVPIIIAGRSHFFNEREELAEALGTGANAIYLTLNDFSTEQIERYLTKLTTYHGPIPDWLPSRPLLIGHLAQRGVLNNLLSGTVIDSRAKGWRDLLRMVCARESSIEDANILPRELQRVLERLATMARAQADGLGPLNSYAIFGAFQKVTGRPPDDAARVLLLRLPGLGPYPGDDSGSRTFIDEDFAESARAGDVLAYSTSPHGNLPEELWAARTSIGKLAASIISVECSERGITNKQLSLALRYAAVKKTNSIVSLDIYRVLFAMRACYDGPPVDIADAVIDNIEIENDMPCLHDIQFVNCLIDQVRVDQDIDTRHTPKFISCTIDSLIGRVSRADVSLELLDNSCDVKHYSSFDKTTAAIMKMNLPTSVKVLLTILKKLFLQPGSGRQESALYAGIDAPAREQVGPILEIIESEKLAKPLRLDRRIVWVPSRSEYARVIKILEAPTQSRDALIERCGELRGKMEERGGCASSNKKPAIQM